MFDRKLFRDLDKVVLLLALSIFLFGLFILYSATQAKGLAFNESYCLRQVNWMLIGTMSLILIISISYQKLIDISYILYGINIVLLILVLILGRARLGAQRWFSIGAFTFQPSEFIKLNLILALSNYIGAKREDMKMLKSLLIPLFLLAVP